jgi:hypothetical protein
MARHRRDAVRAAIESMSVLRGTDFHESALALLEKQNTGG